MSLISVLGHSNLTLTLVSDNPVIPYQKLPPPVLQCKLYFSPMIQYIYCDNKIFLLFLANATSPEPKGFIHLSFFRMTFGMLVALYLFYVFYVLIDAM